jgi:shikimate kinase/3-dehydroquinate synthase
MQQKGPIWLIGSTGVGKSTIGRKLAALTGRDFIDLDDLIEREAGRSIAEIFATSGESLFRALEGAAVARLGNQRPNAVIATGGGTPTVADALSRIRHSGLSIWLRAEVDEILPRLDLQKRPLLANAPDPRAKLAELIAARSPFYARADLTIDRRGRDGEKVAVEIAEWLAAYGSAPLAPPDLAELTVELSARSYPILFDAGANAETRFAALLARRSPPGRSVIGVVSDETVARLHRPRYLAALQQRGFRVVEATVPDGESSKSMERGAQVAEALARGGLDRRSTVVALGGGVVGDLAGFVASILFRGVACAQVPTTLLAQVDSSVGGKTGVNLPSGKNLAGTFHQPTLVFVDLSTLATLPARDLSAGLAEIAKHAFLDGGSLLARLENEAERARAGDPTLLAEVIAASCAIKARVVAGDEREENPEGGRILLNLGHTVGHALESDSHRRGDPLRHGEAVALGLVAAARIGRTLDGADPAIEDRVSALLARLGLPNDLDHRLQPGALDAISVDKKRVGAMVRYVALPRPGAPHVIPIPPSQLALLLSPTANSRYDTPRRTPS